MRISDWSSDVCSSDLQFDPVTGAFPVKKAGGALSYTQIFGDWLCRAAEQDPLIVGITPAMREGSGLVEFSKRFPDRYFDVGIAEQHRSEEHTSELQSLMRISYAVFFLLPNLLDPVSQETQTQLSSAMSPTKLH